MAAFTDISRARIPGFGLRDVASKQIREMLATRSLTDGGLAIHGTNTENTLTAAAVVHTIDGVFKSLAADTEIDISALVFKDGDGNTVTQEALATAKKCVYVFAVDAAGTEFMFQGVQVLEADDAFCPGVAAGYAAFGAVKVSNATGSDFTLGTTALDAASVTDTYYDIAYPFAASV